MICATGLRYRKLEELLAERGIEVDYAPLHRRALRFTPLFIDAGRPSRHAAGSRPNDRAGDRADVTSTVLRGQLAMSTTNRSEFGSCTITMRVLELLGWVSSFAVSSALRVARDRMV